MVETMLVQPLRTGFISPESKSLVEPRPSESSSCTNPRGPGAIKVSKLIRDEESAVRHLALTTAAGVIVSSLAVLVTANDAKARTWYITPDGSGDAPTIAAGLDSAATGDDVLLAPGVFFEHNLNLPQGILL